MHDGGLPTRYVRIAAVAGGAVLIVGLAVAVGTAGGEKPKHKQTPTPALARTQSTTAPASTSPQPTDVPPVVSGSPSTSSSSAPASGPLVRWHGTVIVNGPGAHKDLDSVPPRMDKRESDITGDTFETHLHAGADGVQLAKVTGKPGYQQCRDAVPANGTDRAEDLQNGDVVCLLTSRGRVARLRVLYAAHSFPAATVKAGVTVWDPPLPR